MIYCSLVTHIVSTVEMTPKNIGGFNCAYIWYSCYAYQEKRLFIKYVLEKVMFDQCVLEKNSLNELIGNKCNVAVFNKKKTHLSFTQMFFFLLLFFKKNHHNGIIILLWIFFYPNRIAISSCYKGVAKYNNKIMILLLCLGRQKNIQWNCDFIVFIYNKITTLLCIRETK